MLMEHRHGPMTADTTKKSAFIRMIRVLRVPIISKKKLPKITISAPSAFPYCHE